MITGLLPNNYIRLLSLSGIDVMLHEDGTVDYGNVREENYQQAE
jgi:hypothetical protein